MVRQRHRFVDAQEAFTPGVEHLTGVVEPFLGIAAKPLLEEFGQAVTKRRIEQIAIDGGFAIEMGRITLTIAPFRKIVWPGGEFKQGDRCGIAFGVQIPAFVLSHGEEWIEIPGCSRAKILGRNTRQRKVEQDEV